MARPTPNSISSGLNGWDADVGDNFDIIFDAPIPLAHYANVGALPAAASYDECIAIVDDDSLYYSDGSAWNQLGTVVSFTDLDDVPSSYSGEALNYVRVNAGETALEFAGSVAGPFTDLTDVPSSYSGEGGKLVAVNSGESALEFIDIPIESIVVACSDEATAITGTGTKLTFRMPYAFTLTEVRASLGTACATGTFTVDINESGSSVLSTELTFDATHKTTTTATTPAVISDSALADDAEITVDVDDVGDSGAIGLKVTLIGRKA